MSEATIKSQPAVYRIVNKANGKMYVGSTRNAKNRRHRHFSDLRAGVHHSIHLQRAWDKYGEQSFDFEIVEYVVDQSWLLFVEQAYIDTISKNGIHYNVCRTAGNCAGVKHSEETKRKRSLAMTGRVVSEKTKKAISEAKKGRVTDRMKAASKSVGMKKRFTLTAWDASHFMNMNRIGMSVAKLAALIPINHHAFYRAMREHFPDFSSPVKGGRPHAI